MLQRAVASAEPSRGPTPPLLVCADEAARLLGIGKTTLYQLIKDGVLAPIHIGRCVRFPVAELEALVERLAAQSA